MEKEGLDFEAVIKSRKTEKVLGDINHPLSISNPHFQTTIDELLELAAYAPFHYPSDKAHHLELTSIVPWRFYTLDSQSCRALLQYIIKNHISAGKISNMLATADALLIATWLPCFTPAIAGQEPVPYTGNLKNMEHIAASSAAIQNILLGATSRNISNYWSSGGVLREQTIRERLNIPLSEILLGGIFLFPESVNLESIEIKEGSLRAKGKDKKEWSRIIRL